MAGFLGMDKNKTNSKGASTTTQTLDPRLASTLYGAVDSAKAIADTPAPVYQGVLSPTISPTIGAARDAAQAMTGFSAPSIGASTYAPTMADRTVIDPTALAAAAGIKRGDIRDVTSAGPTADQIKTYEDPYEQDVINAYSADAERARQMQTVADSAKATAAHAFGGSRSGVAAALTNEAAKRSSDSTIAGLRSTGFTTALTAAQADQARKLSADQGNQGVDASVAGKNADFIQQVALANQDAVNTGRITQAQLDAALKALNATSTNQAGQFNAGQTQSADAANQSAALAAAGLRLNANGQLEQIGAAETQNAQEAADREYQDWLRQKQDPLLKQQLLNSTVGLLPNTGTTTGNTSGTVTSVGAKAGATYGT